MTDPEGRVALVTGASRGLGYAVALALGASGIQVVAMARTVGGLEELADEIEAVGGPVPTLVPLSLTDEGGLQRLCLAIHQRWGHLDLAVHCAAHAAPLAPTAHISDRDFDTSLDVNLRGTHRLIVMLQPLLVASPAGRFVYVADTRAGQPFYGSMAPPSPPPKRWFAPGPPKPPASARRSASSPPSRCRPPSAAASSRARTTRG